LGLEIVSGYDGDIQRPEEEMTRLRAPVLIIHAQNDPMIPAEHAVRLHEHAFYPKKLWLAPTVGHGNSLLRAEDDYLNEAIR
jgi:pimeloyl-ACP methyl ester carboxylesterase